MGRGLHLIAAPPRGKGRRQAESAAVLFSLPIVLYGKGLSERDAMDTIAIIDGTGPFRNHAYLSSMEHSFCSQIARAPGIRTQYERGPSLDGVRMLARAERMADFIHNAHMFNPDGRFMLAGYSRGGSAAIMAAERLAQHDIRIAAMFLFDPVARHMRSGGEIIPGNVERVFAAYRSLDPELLRDSESSLAKYSGALADNPALNALSPTTALLARGVDYLSSDWFHPMRPGFGQTALRCASPTTKYVSEIFEGSHGALGGVGWANVTPDKVCQINVARWMTKQMKTVQVNIPLESHEPRAVW
jgi:hypothetical protein